MKRAVLFILWSSLKYFDEIVNLFSRDSYDYFFYDPKTNELYPTNKFSPSKYEKIIIVDSNVVTLKTVIKCCSKLSIPLNKVEIAASVKNEKIGDLIRYKLKEPKIEGLIVNISGLPGCGKSAIARGIAEYLKVPRIKWGDYCKEYAGKYGEKLFEIEKENPFFIAEIVRQEITKLKKYPIIVIDNIKNEKQLFYVSYTTRRPFISFFVEIPEDIRKGIIGLRLMEDDKFDEERKRLFEEYFKKLKSLSITFDITKGFDEYAKFLIESVIGVKIQKIAGIHDNIFITKRNLLNTYLKTFMVAKPKEVNINDLKDSRDLIHRGYIYKLEKKGYKLDEDKKNLIIYTATSFRIVDDILDEHTVRYFSEENRVVPAWWVKRGIFLAVYDAIRLIIYAKYLAYRIGVLEEYINMIKNVVDAVFHELYLEETKKKPTIEDWVVAARRESAFRHFLAKLIGDNAIKWYLDGFIAQMKDDYFGRTKGHREDTEEKLNRPVLDRIIKRDYIPSIIKELEKLRDNLTKSQESVSIDYIERRILEILSSYS